MSVHRQNFHSAKVQKITISIVTVLHQYLLNVPEVLIKLGSGILLGGLGSFWLGEGLGFDWLFGDLAIAAIVLWWLKRDILAVEIIDRED